MDVLILGGTGFLGRHLVEAALGDGHRVTLFNRGLSAPGPVPRGGDDRGRQGGDLSALSGRSWDAAIDTCGYVPRVVRASARLLADAVDHYTFVSSISVYSDAIGPGADEGGAGRGVARPHGRGGHGGDVRGAQGAVRAGGRGGDARSGASTSVRV